MIIQIDRAKKKVMIKREPEPTKAEKAYVVIDYPQDGEMISPPHYAIRIGAAGGGEVEVSINGGDWRKARESAGYYWLDWHPSPTGSHKIVARLKSADGKVKKSKTVSCTSK